MSLCSTSMAADTTVNVGVLARPKLAFTDKEMLDAVRHGSCSYATTQQNNGCKMQQMHAKYFTIHDVQVHQLHELQLHTKLHAQVQVCLRSDKGDGIPSQERCISKVDPLVSRAPCTALPTLPPPRVGLAS